MNANQDTEVTTKEKHSATHELELIHDKKAALQKLVKLTANLNRLSQGLNSVLILGKSVTAIPPKIISNFKSISDKLKPLPTEKLQHSLTSTEIKIKNDIKQVLEITQKSEAELNEYLLQNKNRPLSNAEEGFTEYINDFKKKGQTSIALRIALKTRNAIMTAFLLPVPEVFIKKQIKSLEKRESKYRKQIKKDLLSLFKDVTSLIEDKTITDEMKEELHNTRGQIIANIKHFNDGNNIEKMPIVFESIELSGANNAIDNTIEEQPEPVIVEPVEEIMAEVEEIEIKPLKRSLSGRLWEWATTPTDHSWNDITKESKTE